jgi:hypothetical protein
LHTFEIKTMTRNISPILHARNLLAHVDQLLASVGEANNTNASFNKTTAAREIIVENPDRPCAELLPLLIERAHLTPAGARTYYYRLRREIQQSH